MLRQSPDIEILHSVIATAQEKLDQTPNSKLPPTAALFKAYDEILPQYGIDPDADSHLSALIFRVGGEQGQSTLSSKFQTILERMGIVLEFGDESTLSLGSPHPRSPSPVAFDPSRRYEQQRQDSFGRIELRKQVPRNVVIAQDDPPASPTTSDQVSNLDDHSDHEAVAFDVPRVTPSPPRPLAARVPRLSPSLDREPQQIAPPAQARVEPQTHAAAAAAAVAAAAGTSRVGENGHVASKVAPRMDSFIALPNVRRAALASVVDRWRGAMKRQREWSDVKLKSSDIISEEHQSPKRRGSGSSHHLMDREPQTHDSSPHNSSGPPVLEVQPTTLNGLTATQSFAPKAPVMVRNHQETQAQPSHLAASSAGAVARERHEQQLLLNRAARARQIYLASKVFNHWADRTATRLEREGLARRHMVRFRCFRGWSQAPSSRVPAVDHLRTVTAVQKLKRAVAYQEEQLSIAASTIAQDYRLKTVLRMFDKWKCHLVVETSRRRVLAQTRRNAFDMWQSRAGQSSHLQQAISWRKMDNDRQRVLSCWKDQSRSARHHLQTASQLNMYRLSFDHLEEWAYQAEIKRRAQAYRETLLPRKAANVFERWTLMASAYAFRRRNEYLSVARTFQKWLRRCKSDMKKQKIAHDCFRRTCALGFFEMAEQLGCEEAQRTRLHQGARLYIATTRVLPKMEMVVQKRKSEAKEALRRHLRMRYTEVSSARKKRNFFSALDRWRALASAMSDEAEMATVWGETRELTQAQDALVRWRRRTKEDSNLQSVTQNYHRQAWLSTWSDHAREDEQQELQAWESWAIGRQRQCLKEWSISSLQRSGQAHTASRVQQKYSSERRNRTFQHWRQSFEAARRRSSEHGLRFTPMPAASGPRSGWKSLSARRHLLREGLQEHDVGAGTVDTPTRWTGLPFPMSLAQSARPMPPVRESDEESLLSSVDRDYQRAELSNGRTSRARQPKNLSSTTPRAPVPLSWELADEEPARNRSERFRRSTTTRPARAKTISPIAPQAYSASRITAATRSRNVIGGHTQNISVGRPRGPLDESKNVNYASVGQANPSRSTQTQFVHHPATLAANHASVAAPLSATLQTPIAQQYHLQRSQMGSFRASTLRQRG